MAWRAAPPLPLPPLPPTRRITDAEAAVVEALANAWNLFVALPTVHQDDNTEFRHAIHRAQDIIAYRVAKRVDPAVWGSDKPDPKGR